MHYAALFKIICTLYSVKTFKKKNKLYQQGILYEPTEK